MCIRDREEDVPLSGDMGGFKGEYQSLVGAAGESSPHESTPMYSMHQEPDTTTQKPYLRNSQLKDNALLSPDTSHALRFRSVDGFHEVTHDDFDSKYDSLDYTPIVSHQYLRADATRMHDGGLDVVICGFSTKIWGKWLLVLILGPSMGALAFALSQLTDHIVTWRTDALRHPDGGASIYGWLGFSLWNLAFALVPCLCCIWQADPASKASGIPEVKAHLNGIRMPRLFSIGTFLIKFFGTAFAVGSGLVLGPEGPLIYLGAAMAAGLSRGSKTISLNLCGREIFSRTIRFPWKRVWANDSDRRDFIAIGAATGFAAAFGAPVGGVLFALEETVSFWSPSLLLRGMCTTSLATFMLLACNWIQSGNCCDLENFGLIQLEYHADAHIAVLPFSMIAGLFGGVIGGVFLKIWAKMAAWRKSNSRRACILELCAVSLFSSLVIYYLPRLPGNCKPRDRIQTQIQLGGDNHVSYNGQEDFMVQFDCAEGEFNQLASIFYGKREDVIKSLIEDPRAFSAGFLLIASLADLLLLLLVYGTWIPGGIFLPSIVIGTAWGGAFGVFVNTYIASSVQPSSMAIMGAVAVLNGIQRSTVSVAIIIVEGTGKIGLLLPIILAGVISRIVGQSISKGIYDVALEMKRIPMLDLDLNEGELYHAWDHIDIKDVMSTDVCTVSAVCSETELKCALTMTNHNGFPVTDEGRLVGLVLRSQLVVLIGAASRESSRSAASNKPDQPSKTAPKNRTRLSRLSMSTPNQSVQLVDEQLEQMSKHTFDDMIVDPSEGAPTTFSLDGIMNKAVVCVQQTCPVSTAYNLFCTMGLRHLVVVNPHHEVVGIITRVDLVRCHRLVPDWDSLYDKSGIPNAPAQRGIPPIDFRSLTIAPEDPKFANKLDSSPPLMGRAKADSH
eukprot:TRINITY_DN23376_c0_g1_i1.p1 TRINITY_DN23376_c0_g1~~TRINITY_DN23376_c0_g1_i1.p1  ORF type:complete len:898 (+),score=227.99 TRINITY_DN23376_c0_g1_i1:132-2825(+)